MQLPAASTPRLDSVGCGECSSQRRRRASTATASAEPADVSATVSSTLAAAPATNSNASSTVETNLLQPNRMYRSVGWLGLQPKPKFRNSLQQDAITN